MRVFVIVLALLLACAAVALAEDYTSSSSINAAQPSGIGAGSSASAAANNQFVDVTQNLNISQQQINSLRSQGLTNADIAMAAAISARTGYPIDAVVSQWRTTRDWNQVVSFYNLSMADLTAMPMATNADIENFNTVFLSQYYSIPQSQISSLRSQGYSWNDISMLANAAIRTNQPITQIASLRSQGKSWADIATAYNVASGTITSPINIPFAATTGMACATTACPTTVTAGAGPFYTTAPQITMPCMVYDIDGNIILNEDQALNLYANGYDWLDVAVAANITRYTGVPLTQVLTNMKGVGTWWNLITDYGVPANVAFNVADYPFPKRTIYSCSVNEANLKSIAKYQCAGLYPSCAYPPPRRSSCSSKECQQACPTVCPPGTILVPNAAPGTVVPSTGTYGVPSTVPSATGPAYGVPGTIPSQVPGTPPPTAY